MLPKLTAAVSHLRAVLCSVLRRLQKSGKRNEIFLATKFGMALNGPLPDGRHVCGDPEYAAASIDRSLKLLQTDHVDLWYLHR